MATSTLSPENLHERYQLALRASSAALAASDPSDTLTFWTAVASILDMSIVTLRQLGAPVPAEQRIFAIGGIGQQLEAAHASIHRIGRWTTQVHRTLAQAAEGEAPADTTAEAAPELPLATEETAHV
jgi:hypothetical protein